MIRRLKHHQIDKAKWDAVIVNSDNPHVYILSWYLDIVSPGWECFIFDDYKYVMPLPIKFIWGIQYLVQPPFCQRTGIIGIGVRPDISRLFYEKLFWRFPYFNLHLESSSGVENRKYLNGRINYTLDLTPPYESILKNYKGNSIRNLKKAANSKLNIEDCSVNDYLEFCQTWLLGVDKNQKQIFNSLVISAFHHKATKIFRVTNSKREIVAAACFMVWNRQILYLAGASSTQGRKLSAMFLILDKVIEEYAETGYLLDFEGSMIPGVADFFRGFGAKASYYYHLKKYLFFYK